MTKKQYLDKVYTTAHELLTLYRECFPEEAAAGGISLSFHDENSIEPYPNLSAVNLHAYTPGSDPKTTHTLSLDINDGNKAYRENYEVI